MVEILRVLPLAFLMIAGPQIVTAIFLATGSNAKKSSASFLAGVAIAVALGTTISFEIASHFTGFRLAAKGHRNVDAYWVIIALLVFLGIWIFVRRKRATSQPKWMSNIQNARAGHSIIIGFLLFFVFPTDLISWLSVGANDASRHNPYWYNLVFALIVVILAATPLILLLMMGKRAQVLLPKVRDWMNTHSWVVSEILVVFFILISLPNVL